MVMKKASDAKGGNDLVTKAYLDTRLKGLENSLYANLRAEMKDMCQDILRTIRDEMGEKIQNATIKVLAAVDKILARFDRKEKEEAAHTMLHKRITDDLHNHETRIKTLETR